jgi:hypothetical protein
MKKFKNPFTKVNAQHAAISVVCNVAGTLHFGLQASADIVKSSEAHLVHLINKDYSVNRVRRVRNITYYKDVKAIQIAYYTAALKLEIAKTNLANAVANVRTKLTTDTSDDVPNFGTLQ